MAGAPCVLVVGEALVDVIIGGDGRRTAHPGGSPANVALGLGRLGSKVTLLTDLGDDDYGQLVRTHLVEARVTVLAANRPGAVTSTATARLAADGSATYEFALSWDVETNLAPPSPTVLHTGSLGAVLGDDRVARLVAECRGRSLISYDPNIRPDAMGTRPEVLRRVEYLVGLSDLVKVSDDDVAWLYPEVPPETTAHEWSLRGPRVVILTRGATGVECFTAGERTHIPAAETTVIDTVGAGDSFMAALLHFVVQSGVVRAADLELGRDGWHSALAFASAAAAITVSRSGADLPYLADLDAGSALRGTSPAAEVECKAT